MGNGPACDEKISFRSWFFRQVADSAARLAEKTCSVLKKVKKVGEDDPRRIVHSLKVGLALTFISLLYLLRPPYDYFGINATWAVITVVFVFEYTVGATLGKGLNRVFGTLLAAALAVGVHYLASLLGEIGEAVILGASVFLTGAVTTFVRFFPEIKSRYDYGMVIFILTFSLIAVSGYRVIDLIEMAHQRVSTIVIGSFTCVFISISIRPVWAGEELHKMVALNLQKLGNFLKGFGDEYFGDEYLNEDDGANADARKKDKSFLEAYKSVLNSKTSEETLANFAKWEPHHGRFRFHHPWHQYLKIGALARKCACSIDVLNKCTSSKIQVPLEFQKEAQEACRKMSSESGKALMELSSAIRKMTKPTVAAIHVARANIAADDLKTAMKTTSSEVAALLEILPAATIALLLVQIVAHTNELLLAIDELAKLANFKNPVHQAAIRPFSEDVLIGMPVLESNSPENASSQVSAESRRVEV